VLRALETPRKMASPQSVMVVVGIIGLLMRRFGGRPEG
jgi:hypothetical protein